MFSNGGPTVSNPANEQQLLLVDEEDRFSGGYVNRGEAHTGAGQHHRAFVCLAIDAHGRVLLQRRKHWLWDDLWDCSAVSHVLHLSDRDETYEEAARRALSVEMTIEAAAIGQHGGFNYFAQHFDGVGCENEYCAILVTRFDGEPRPNADAVYEVRWLSLEDYRQEVQARPDAYTPWARLAVETLVASADWPPS
jgi:isopentenyl-diphosphate delta-isomerase